MATVSYPYRRTPVLPQIIAVLVGGLVLFLGLVFTWVVGYQLLYAGRIFPGVSVAGVDLSGMKKEAAAVKLNQALAYPLQGKILFRDGEKAWIASPAQLGMVFDPSASAETAYRLGRRGGLFGALAGQLQAFGVGAHVPPVILFDQRVAFQYLSNISTQIDQPMLEASVKLDGTNVVTQSGQVGRELKINATLIYLGSQLQTFTDGEVPLVIQELQPQVLDVSGQADVARQILSQPLTLVVPNDDGTRGPYVYNPDVLSTLLGFQPVRNGDQVSFQAVLDPNRVRNLLSSLTTEVDRPPANAKFVFNDETRQLDLIANSTNGRVMDVEASIQAINDSLLRGEHTVNLVITEAQPQVASTATAQELGITELVSAETSYFYGSSTERKQNIAAAAARFHGVLVAPGETFSMGATMGDVSLDNGFAEALIIYGGRTIKGVGGGVCQVSTTLFRTVLNAGLPIVERTPHAYRVSYYERTSNGGVDPALAGLDATVYFPLVDFKFTNDTPNWILMETYMSDSSLTWKFYSTSDGRSVTLENSGPTNVVSAPPPLFEQNPELGKNEMKQVDWSANGADVSVTRTVWKNGVVLFQDQINTHYEPWQAVCEFGPDSKNPEKLAQEKNLCLNPSG